MDQDLYSHEDSSSEDMESLRRSRGKGASRISSACIECRRKKQKCSGDKPVCSECRAMGKACEWPQPQRRGPSKNYIADLETRLTETECLLIGVLPHINAGQLHNAVTRQRQMLQGLPSSRSQPEGKISQKKFGSSYWNKFPITNPEGVKRWWFDRKNRAAEAGMPFAGSRSSDQSSSTYQGQVPGYGQDPSYGGYGGNPGGSQFTLPTQTFTGQHEGPYQAMDPGGRMPTGHYDLEPPLEGPGTGGHPSQFYW